MDGEATEPDDHGVDEAALARARALVDGAESITVLTGAGISTDSGIPDFRGPKGLWTRNPKAEATSNIAYYVRDPEVRRLAWRSRLDSTAWSAEPNAGHLALVALERRGTLRALITQNVDGLHHAAGNDPDLVIEAHGTMRRWVCLSCDAGGPMAEALDRVRLGEDDPACRAPVGSDGEACGGILKSATVSYGQQLDPVDLERADEAAADCDLFLAVGSTLSVYPIAQVVSVAHHHGAPVVIVNAQPTPYDPIAAEVLRGQIGRVLPTLVGV
ncbi:MAG TPA: Sir2 family NAD-dependent protein deacetylase [Acidimicrobiales bacterium]|nr:Sir2 family NAD-dependent protein deacetylase [Acidimicrobiales bacterium]